MLHELSYKNNDINDFERKLIFELLNYNDVIIDAANNKKPEAYCKLCI